jgi:hypothetical protein
MTVDLDSHLFLLLDQFRLPLTGHPKFRGKTEVLDDFNPKCKSL